MRSSVATTHDLPVPTSESDHIVKAGALTQ